MHKLKLFFQTKPVFLILLPVFFVLHAWMENFGFIPVKDASSLAIYYILSSVVLTMLFLIFYRNMAKAALASFSILAFNFFFGSTHDFLKRIAGDTFIVRYSFVLPASFLLLLLLLIYLKKAKRNFERVILYANMLFTFLILMDIGNAATKSSTGNRMAFSQEAFVACDSCTKPDIYLIIADEYAGSKELRDIFSFDNAQFESDLQHRGFHVVSNTKSNYNWTIYSVASMLGMDYLKNLESQAINNKDMIACSDIINDNKLLHFFKGLGYSMYNCSVFDFDGQPKPANLVFLPTPRSLVTGQTFVRRIKRDLAFNFATPKIIEGILKDNLFNNSKLDSLTRRIACEKKSQPKFVYTHLLMPHYAYYFDSLGGENPIEKLYDRYKTDKEQYLSYLVYTNKKLLHLIDQIRICSTRPPVIILISDHGYRQFTEPVPHQYYFINLNAVYLPGGDYSSFYDGMTNVNQFRIILNTLFKQKLPLLKDSTSFLEEPYLNSFR